MKEKTRDGLLKIGLALIKYRFCKNLFNYNNYINKYSDCRRYIGLLSPHDDFDQHILFIIFCVNLKYSLHITFYSL